MKRKKKQFIPVVRFCFSTDRQTELRSPAGGAFYYLSITKSFISLSFPIRRGHTERVHENSHSVFFFFFTVYYCYNLFYSINLPVARVHSIFTGHAPLSYRLISRGLHPSSVDWLRGLFLSLRGSVSIRLAVFVAPVRHLANFWIRKFTPVYMLLSFLTFQVQCYSITKI